MLEFDFQPIVSEGQDLGALWMFRDATDRVLYQEALARARDEAIAASDAKSQFLASMSHEIRTPMHGVLATLDLLRTTDLDGEQRELVDVIDSSATNLVSIINDILDLQKVEAGRIDLVDRAVLAVAEAARAVVDLLGPQARAKGIELSPRRSTRRSRRSSSAIPLRLRQVLVNLAGNAVKFTQSGSVSLVVAASSRGAGTESVVEVEVRDTGPGIAAETGRPPSSTRSSRRAAARRAPGSGSPSPTASSASWAARSWSTRTVGVGLGVPLRAAPPRGGRRRPRRPGARGLQRPLLRRRCSWSRPASSAGRTCSGCCSGSA